MLVILDFRCKTNEIIEGMSCFITFGLGFFMLMTHIPIVLHLGAVFFQNVHIFFVNFASHPPQYSFPNDVNGILLMPSQICVVATAVSNIGRFETLPV